MGRRSEISFAATADPSEISTVRQSSWSNNSSESDLLRMSYSLPDKLKSSARWIIEPFKRCCFSSSSGKDSQSVSPIQKENLKPELNRVNGLLKYFAFGVMFTNGILGFLLFLVGLWSSFEQRKISSMPNVEDNDRSTFNPFQSIGILFCIFGLLFFLLAMVSCLGINRENLQLLRISLISQSVTLVIFLILAIVILIWSENIRHRIAEGMITGLQSYYHRDETWMIFFDKLQLNYFCCGVYSFDDWNQNPHYACTTANRLQSFDACSVPFTCCKTSKNQDESRSLVNTLEYKCGENILPMGNQTFDMEKIHERIHVNGCFDEILPVIQQLIITASIFMFLICIIVVVTIFLTCLISFEIRLTASNVRRFCRKKNSKEEEEEKF